MIYVPFSIAAVALVFQMSMPMGMTHVHQNITAPYFFRNFVDISRSIWPPVLPRHGEGANNKDAAHEMSSNRKVVNETVEENGSRGSRPLWRSSKAWLLHDASPPPRRRLSLPRRGLRGHLREGVSGGGPRLRFVRWVDCGLFFKKNVEKRCYRVVFLEIVCREHENRTCVFDGQMTMPTIVAVEVLLFVAVV